MYESSRQNILGILYVKDLILVDPDDETELSAVLAFRSALLSLWSCGFTCSTCGVPLTRCHSALNEAWQLRHTQLQVFSKMSSNCPRIQFARRQPPSCLLYHASHVPGRPYASFCCTVFAGPLVTCP